MGGQRATMPTRLTPADGSATNRGVELEAEAGDVAPRRRRRIPRMGRARLVLGALALGLLVALLVVWSQRRPIATGYIDQELAKRGVPARYRIADIGLRTQRLENVVIGDPARPDLVADWVEVITSIGFGVPEVTGIRAGHVRVRARLENGEVRLGAIDRLLPPPSGKPFVLPALDADVADARVRLETPAGVVGLKLSGSGGLADGFVGRLAAVAERLEAGGCGVDRTVAALALRIHDGQPSIAGPVRAAAAACAGVQARDIGLVLDGTLGEALDRWRGRAGLALGRVAGAGARIERLEGVVSFDGGPQRTSGELALTTRAMAAAGLAAGSSSLDGRYHVGTRGSGFDGTLAAEDAALPRAMLATLNGLGAQAAGTPVAPLLAKAGSAAAAAGRDFRVEAALAVIAANGRGIAMMRRLSLTGANGARATLSGGSGVSLGWPDARLRVDGRVTLAGGGLPGIAATLRQAAPGQPVTGSAVVDDYAAPGASLALTPVAFRAGPGGTRITTRATLSGPLADGRIEALAAPVDLRWDGAGRLLANPGCTPIAFASARVSSLSVGATRLTACATGPALAIIDASGLRGGARVDSPRFAGRIGGAPLQLAAARATYDLGANRFALADVRTAIGAPGRVTRIDAASLDGQVAGGGVGGRFAGAAGQVANVPLLLGEAAGDWRFAGGRLALTGAARVSDAAPDPRFAPLTAPALTLTLAGNRIDAAGALVAAKDGTRVADVTIVHDLAAGRGQADLTVPALVFGEGYQPADLTRLALGVVADVRGTVTGEGHIRWSPDDVTSTGVFRTTGTDLAAAFGPVSGLSGEIVFTDLLNLQTAPGQVVTLAEVNPGVPVSNGLIRYHLSPGLKVGIEGGTWPFAGGTLTLEPTLLDFGQEGERRMTFAVTGMDAALFLQQFDFDNLYATGIFDGTLPIVFGGLGARIEGGRLQVRQGGGRIAYVGELTEKDLGFWGNVAFQALKSLTYRDLSMEMNGPLDGEMLTAVRFSGVSQGEGATSNFIIRRLQRLPFRFNVNIRAPFRQLFDSVKSYYDPTRLIERNLPTLLQQQPGESGAAPTPTPPAPPVQPIESEKRP